MPSPPIRGACVLGGTVLVSGCQAEGEFQSLADAMSVAILFWVGVIVLGLALLVWLIRRARPRV